ncbi:MAG TPA: tetratricopeptide repeat protein [Pyrinomonadaceae bacterium]|nr:tetratricopeptide repeat protein [Pyrinomonadaceae bacterium]
MKMRFRFPLATGVLLISAAFCLAQTTGKDSLDRVLSEFQAGHQEKALAALDDAIKQYPNNADAYMLRGSLMMGAAPEQALADFTRVIELKPDSGQAYNQRALLRLTKNDVTGALKDLDAAIANNFRDDGIYGLRANLRWQTGDLAGARTDMDESIRLNPNNPRSYAERGDLLMALKETDRALADYDYLLKWYETDPVARPAPKKADQNEKRPGDQTNSNSQAFTVGLSEQTVNDSPGDKRMAPVIAGAYVNRGFSLSRSGAHDRAMSDFTKAIKVDGANIWAFYDRANEYEIRGDLTSALADINTAVEIDPNNGNLVVERGILLKLMGKEKDAQAEFDRLLKSDSALWQKRIDSRMAAVKQQLPAK